MRFSWLVYFFTGVATLAVFAGCSFSEPKDAVSSLESSQNDHASRAQTTGQQILLPYYSLLPPAMHRVNHETAGNASNGFLESGASSEGFFSAFSTVFIYNSAGKQTGMLTGFFNAYGLATDGLRNLYVADFYNARVQVYAPPYMSPPTTLHDVGELPFGVAADEKRNVAVTNYLGSGFATPGDVVFFNRGGTIRKSISSSALAIAFFCAFDASGNLYLDGLPTNNENNSFVGEVVGGVTGSSIATLTTANVIQRPGGIQVTKSGFISILDTDAKAIYTYKPPRSGALGYPLTTTLLKDAIDPLGFALNPSNSHAFVADQGDFSGGFVEEYNFPAGGSAIGTISNGYNFIGAAIAEQP